VTGVAIIDSGGANIASLIFAFERLQIDAVLTSNADTIKNADRVVLPGVGAAKDAMARLSATGLVDVIRELTQPVLGICLGMQLLCDGSEEEDVECLGVVSGAVKKLQPHQSHRVPNMGWCSTQFTHEHPVFAGIDEGSYFYYLHSYALPVSANTLATADHANKFSAIVGKENFIAVQFHPERSAAAGARLLKNFVELPA